MSSAESFIGTWRPHKPRGPIAALYRSPGPKYSLPGLTGGSQHDPTKKKAPMFSIRKRFNSKFESSPGPVLLPSNITRVGRDGTPAFSIFSRPKEQKFILTPGPGQYSPEQSGKSIFRSAPAYSLSGRMKEFSNLQSPGPASYCLPPVLGHTTVVKPAASAYSFGGRIKSHHNDLNRSPGPAAYKDVDPCICRQKAPQYSMAGYKSSPIKVTPGPGAHRPEQVTATRAKAPSYSFGMRHSEFIVELIVPEHCQV